MSESVDAVFCPPGEAWSRVSPRLSTARRLLVLMVGVPVTAVAAAVVVAAGAPPAAGAAVAAAGAGVLIWAWWLIGRRVRSYGYAERADDLLITSGILVRRLTVVPYGRMQLVEVASGPLDRSLGLTTVTLHTASAGTGATIPGLPPQEAAVLRDRLAAMGEQRSPGL